MENLACFRSDADPEVIGTDLRKRRGGEEPVPAFVLFGSDAHLNSLRDLA